jgi:hypothetical protein
VHFLDPDSAAAPHWDRRWSNLVKPAQKALQLTSNSSAYDAQTLPSQQQRRRLLSLHHGHEYLAHLYDRQMEQRQRRQLRQAAASRNGGSSDATTRQDVAAWLSENSQAHGSYVGSNSSGSGTTGALVFAADGSSNGNALVPGATNALLVAATTRWPAAYSVRELEISLLVLFAATAVATVLQVVAWAVWKLFKLNAEDYPK